MNLRGQEGRAEIILTPHPESLPMNPGGPSPHPGPLPSHPMGAERESAFAKATADRWQADGGYRSNARQNAAGSGEQGANHSGNSLPVEGRGKPPSSDLRKLGVHGPDARPFLEVEAPHEPRGPSPHPGPLPSHPMGAERESAFAKATADRWQADGGYRLNARQDAAGSGGKARIFRGSFIRTLIQPIQG